jgi:hypothetical protein
MPTEIYIEGLVFIILLGIEEWFHVQVTWETLLIIPLNSLYARKQLK